MQLTRIPLNLGLSVQFVGLRRGYKVLHFGYEGNTNYIYVLENTAEDIVFAEVLFHRTGDCMDVSEVCDYNYKGSFNQCETGEMIHVFMKDKI